MVASYGNIWLLVFINTFVSFDYLDVIGFVRYYIYKLFKAQDHTFRIIEKY